MSIIIGANVTSIKIINFIIHVARVQFPKILILFGFFNAIYVWKNLEICTNANHVDTYFRNHISNKGYYCRRYEAFFPVQQHVQYIAFVNNEELFTSIHILMRNFSEFNLIRKSFYDDFDIYENLHVNQQIIFDMIQFK